MLPTSSSSPPAPARVADNSTNSNSNELGAQFEPVRFVGLDISKRSVMVAAVNSKQQVILQPKKVGVERFERWALDNLRPSDAVVLEATFNAWYFYDLLLPLVGSVRVCDPNQNPSITRSKVKTDERDAIALAKLLEAGFITPVWVPPQPVRDLRSLITHRQRMSHQRVRTLNHLHAVLLSHNILPPDGNPFGDHNQQWWGKLAVSSTLKLMIEQEWAMLNKLDTLLKQVEAEIIELSNTENWSKPVTYLIQLPGIGVITAMTILGAIGDITRFKTAKKLVGYSGLGASIYASGDVKNTGSITKQGRKELRGALVEAAWSAVGGGGYWQEQHQRLSARLGKNKAIVAIARKLLVIIWHVLSKGEADQKANEVKVARKMLDWSYKLRRAGRQGLRGKEFARLRLETLGVGRNLTQFIYNGKPFELPLAATLNTG